MVIAQILNTLGIAIVKYVYRSNKSFTAFEATTSRALFQIIFNQGIIFCLGLSYRSIKREDLKKLCIRFSLGYPAWTMLYYSVDALPVGLSFTIQNLTPFFTLIFAYVVLKEGLKRLEVYNMGASFLGVLIIVWFSKKDGDGSKHLTEFDFAIGVFLNTLSAILIALVNVVIRSLKSLHFAVAAGFQAILTFSVSLLVLIFYRLAINSDFDYATFTGLDLFLIVLNGLV